MSAVITVRRMGKVLFSQLCISSHPGGEVPWSLVPSAFPASCPVAFLWGGGGYPCSFPGLWSQVRGGGEWYPSPRFFSWSLVPSPFPGGYPISRQGIPTSQDRTRAPPPPPETEQKSEYLLRSGSMPLRSRRRTLGLYC